MPVAGLLAPLLYAGVVVALLNVIVIAIYLLRQRPKRRAVILYGLGAIASAVYFGFTVLPLI